MIKYITPGGIYSPLYYTMAQQNHLLIAGTTGSGKSVAENGIIHALLVNNSPAKTQFIFIDSKKVELIDYKNIPHCLYYASTMADIRTAFRTAIDITEKRFEIMQAQRTKKYNGNDLYIIIDELADLMTTDKKFIAPILQRLAQIGRAARVHVIACTQCPIAKVIPTEIKVNFDARLGLRTRSPQDSRNILDVSCCETLPRYGKGYFLTAEGLQLVTLPLIPETEYKRIINYWQSENCTTV